MTKKPIQKHTEDLSKDCQHCIDLIKKPIQKCICTKMGRTIIVRRLNCPFPHRDDPLKEFKNKTSKSELINHSKGFHTKDLSDKCSICEPKEVSDTGCGCHCGQECRSCEIKDCYLLAPTKDTGCLCVIGKTGICIHKDCPIHGSKATGVSSNQAEGQSNMTEEEKYYFVSHRGTSNPDTITAPTKTSNELLIERAGERASGFIDGHCECSDPKYEPIHRLSEHKTSWEERFDEKFLGKYGFCDKDECEMHGKDIKQFIASELSSAKEEYKKKMIWKTLNLLEDKLDTTELIEIQKKLELLSKGEKE